MLYESGPLLRNFAAGINFTEWANLCRIHERMKLMTAVATMIAEAIGVIEYREVAAKVGEMVTYTQMWHHAMEGVEHGAHLEEGGLMSLGSMAGMNIYFAQTSARMGQLLREVSGVKGGEKVYHCGGGIVYHRHDEKGLNWEPGGIRSGAGVRSSGVSQESTGSSDTWEAALCRLCLRR